MKYALVTNKGEVVEKFTPHECEDAFKTIAAHDSEAIGFIFKREYSRSRNMYSFAELAVMHANGGGYTKQVHNDGMLSYRLSEAEQW